MADSDMQVIKDMLDRSKIQFETSDGNSIVAHGVHFEFDQLGRLSSLWIWDETH